MLYFIKRCFKNNMTWTYKNKMHSIKIWSLDCTQTHRNTNTKIRSFNWKPVLTGVSWQKLSRTGSKSETNWSLLAFSLDDDRVPVLQELSLVSGTENTSESCLFGRNLFGRQNREIYMLGKMPFDMFKHSLQYLRIRHWCCSWIGEHFLISNCGLVYSVVVRRLSLKYISVHVP